MDPGTVVVSLAQVFPYTLSAFLIWKKWSRKKHAFSVVFLAVLASITIVQLLLIWADQFHDSRGFGLIFVAEIHFFAFLPAWLASLLYQCIHCIPNKLKCPEVVGPDAGEAAE